jgi:hypothetical protein
MRNPRHGSFSALVIVRYGVMWIVRFPPHSGRSARRATRPKAACPESGDLIVVLIVWNGVGSGRQLDIKIEACDA